MKRMGTFALATVGLVAGVAAVLGLFAPDSAAADQGVAEEGAIVISLGEAAPLPDGGTEHEVVRWVEGGAEVDPVPDVRVITAATE